MVSQTLDLQVQTKIDSKTPDIRMHGRIITTKVVGVSFEGRQEVVAKLQMGDRIWLEREPFNPYDVNAIRVTRNNGEQIGYLSRHLARSLAPLMDRLCFPIRGKVYLLTGSRYEDYSLGVVIAFKLPKHDQHTRFEDWDE
jgi:hypothetical protein